MKEKLTILMLISKLINVTYIYKIQQQYLPKASYITAASPQIASAYQKLLKKPVSTILNVFPKPNISLEKSAQKHLKLFWF